MALLAKLRATPSVGSLYNDMIKNAKGLVFLSTWKAGILYVGGQVIRCTLPSLSDSPTTTHRAQGTSS